jgi:predicted MPP superfamily phosphohydrolase
MRVFFALVLCGLLPLLLQVLVAKLFGEAAGWIAAGLWWALTVYGTLFGWRHIVVRTADCTSDLLPQEFDGYRILQLSDIHIGTFGRNPSVIKKMVNMALEQHPDLIVFTGDLVNVGASEVIPFMHELARLSAPDGIFSVMGNHDYCEYGMDPAGGKVWRSGESSAHRNKRILEYMEQKVGWRLLMNDHVLIERKGAKIALIGVENISKPPFPEYGNLPKAMGDLPRGMFKILLSHDPSHWRRGVLHSTDIALTLSGHTHAGQLKVGRFSPAKWAYHEWGGKYTEDGSMLYVSLGIGGTMPFRVGAWPEINVITLRKKN